MPTPPPPMTAVAPKTVAIVVTRLLPGLVVVAWSPLPDAGVDELPLVDTGLAVGTVVVSEGAVAPSPLTLD